MGKVEQRKEKEAAVELELQGNRHRAKHIMKWGEKHMQEEDAED